jgi:3-hydroxybutyryl-CoA dehydrogenase
MSIETIAVCGAGTMGAGVAQVAAQSGFKVFLFDVNEKVVAQARKSIEKNWQVAIEKGKMSEANINTAKQNINYTSNITDCKVDLVIEAIVEKLEVKQSVFKQLAEINTEQCILATNTSSLSVTQIAAGIPLPGRVAGIHFFNPAHLMKLVEVISGAATDITTINALKDVAKQMGKTVVLAKDAPGFIVNRVARHFYVENLKMMEEAVADLAVLDSLCENVGFKMGAFKLMDMIGNDINYAVTESLFNALHQDSKFRPSRIQQQKVLANHLGKKTGKGFYNYF